MCSIISLIYLFYDADIFVVSKGITSLGILHQQLSFAFQQLRDIYILSLNNSCAYPIIL